jgi:hypothetical protein
MKTKTTCVGNGFQVFATFSPASMVSAVSHHVKFYGQTGTDQDSFSLNQLNASNKSVNHLYRTAESHILHSIKSA